MSRRSARHRPDTTSWLAWESTETGASRTATAVVATAFATSVVASLFIVSVAAAHANTVLSPTSRVGDYPSWLAGPLAPLTSWWTPSSHDLEAIFTFGVVAMYIGYVAVLIHAPRLRPAWPLAGMVLLQLIYFVSPPLPLTDIFNYLNYGRMEILHHLNPYTTIPALEPHTDPTFALSNWHGLESPYGPLFTLLTLAVVPLGVAGSYWAMKTVLLATSLASVWLVWRSAALLGRNRLAAALFLGLNPIVLVWGLGADHNDFLMIFVIAIAMYLLIAARIRRAAVLAEAPVTGVADDSGFTGARARARRAISRLDGAPRPLVGGEPGWWWEIAAGIGLAAAVAIKASAAILLPIFIAGSGRRGRLTAGIAIGLLGFGAASYAAFGANTPNLAQQDGLVIPLGIPNVSGYLIGIGGVTVAWRAAFEAVLVAVIAGCTVWAWRIHDWLVPVAWATVALLVTLSWVLPWYLLWLLPFAALARGRRTRVAAIVLGVFLILTFMPYATSFWRDVGINPGTTITGRTDQRYLHALVN